MAETDSDFIIRRAAEIKAAEAAWLDCTMRLGTSGPDELMQIARRYFMEGHGYGVEHGVSDGLRRASAALDDDTAFYLVIEKRIIEGERLGVVDDVQDNMVAWLASRADSLSTSSGSLPGGAS